MSGNQLDAFLKGGTPPEAAPPAAPAAEPAAGTGDPKPSVEAKAPPAAKAAPAPEPEDDTDPGPPQPGEPGVPLKALESERARRQNWVERAGRAEAERDALARQLEEAKKPPYVPAAPPPRMEPIDPATDPAGYTARVQGVVLNERLNVSEMMAVEKHGQDTIDAEVAYFKKRADADPRLWQELYSKPHPYQWMIGANATAKLHDEIGTDPAAYEAKLRQKWEQERGNGNAAPPVSPAAGLPPSLAGVRSAAARGTNGFSGPPSMDDILSRPRRTR